MNINEVVRVELTEAGKAYAAARRGDYITEAERRGEWQLWRLMAVFGPGLCMGMPENFFVRNEVAFDVPPSPKPVSLQEEIRAAINRHSRENASNTPDFILAEFMLACLAAFEHATVERCQWWGPREAQARRELLGPGSRRIDDSAAKQIERPLNSTPGQGGPG